jgi:hypothetical protein
LFCLVIAVQLGLHIIASRYSVKQRGEKVAYRFWLGFHDLASFETCLTRQGLVWM